MPSHDQSATRQRDRARLGVTDLRRTLARTAEDLIESAAAAGDDETSRALDRAVDEAAGACRTLIDALEDWLLGDVTPSGAGPSGAGPGAGRGTPAEQLTGHPSGHPAARGRDPGPAAR